MLSVSLSGGGEEGGEFGSVAEPGRWRVDVDSGREWIQDRKKK